MNGPEILDKFIGEAERRVRELFAPAEREYEEVGDASALHLIILDEIGKICEFLVHNHYVPSFPAHSFCLIQTRLPGKEAV